MVGRFVAARALAKLLPNLTGLLRGLLRDQRVPPNVRWVLRLALAYVVSPIDLVPEFIPVVGPLDDVLVVGLALRYAVRQAGPGVVRDNWKGDEQTLAMLLRLSGVADRRVA